MIRLGGGFGLLRAGSEAPSKPADPLVLGLSPLAVVVFAAGLELPAWAATVGVGAGEGGRSFGVEPMLLSEEVARSMRVLVKGDAVPTLFFSQVSTTVSIHL